MEEKWPGMGDWLPGAVDALRELSRIGQVRIHTCRIAPVEPDEYTPRPAHLVKAEIDGIRKMLDEQGLHAVEIHDKPWKPPASEYIDNKGRRYSGRPGSWKALTKAMVGLYGKE